MRFCQYDQAQGFLERVLPDLEQNEVANNLALGILFSLAKSDEKRRFAPYLALLNEGERVPLALVRTPPHNLVLATGKGCTTAHIDYAVQCLLEKGIELPGVIGELDIATRFAQIWAEKTGSSLVVEMNQRIYQIEKVNSFARPSGTFRLAREEEAPLLAQWVHSFATEALEDSTESEALQIAQRFISRKGLYVWDNNGPVSMAAKTRPTQNGIVVSLVYTPGDKRGQGYATACVGALSTELLKSYRYCSLYTDLSNPTSNSIYMKLGYKPICDSIVLKFAAE